MPRSYRQISQYEKEIIDLYNQDDGLPPSIQNLDKLAQMRYVMASKDRYIKRLEMENELMRDFLSLTERK